MFAFKQLQFRYCWFRVQHREKYVAQPCIDRGNSSERSEQTWYYVCSDHLEGLHVDGRILKLTLKKTEKRVRTGLIWLRIGTSGGIL